jgi:hypothetical protein
MNNLRIFELLGQKKMKKLNRNWLYSDEIWECSARAKKINMWLYFRRHPMNCNKQVLVVSE